MSRSALAFVSCLLLASPALAQREFGFDNRKASGQPYIPAEESVKRFKMTDGWEAHVVASEPEVINPIAFTIDEKGRIWVVECFEYPSRTPKGKKPRDRIKILESTKGDGKIDKVTVWAEGKDLPIGWDLASGIEVGHGGVFLGAPPYLFFLSDPENTGKCTKQEVLLKGFGSQDTHETLNTFQWGPDGKLYGLHGVFTVSKVDGVEMTAAVWRYDVHKKKFEIFAEGTSNPWGMDFDRNGQCFLACCVIPHLFHMVPGGTYKRQAGASLNPYTYGLLNEICDHTHHKLSGWAHAGLIVLEGEQVPEKYKHSLVMGSIHGCSLKRNTLKPNGSTFIGSSAPDFMVSGDKNFRPINLRWGPDGSIYCIDWHDQNPCHQAAPDSWDMTHGRIFRFQPKGMKRRPAEDLTKKTSVELVELLKEENPYWYRTATRLLEERKAKAIMPKLVEQKLVEMTFPKKDPAPALRAIWALHRLGALDEDRLFTLMARDDAWVRSWLVRLIGERGRVSDLGLKGLTDVAALDHAPQTQLALAGACQHLIKQDTLPILHNLMKHADKKDPCLPLMIWFAYEPRVMGKRDATLDWLKANATGNVLVTDEIVPRTLRRLADSRDPEALDAAVRFLVDVKDAKVRRRGLEGLLASIKLKVDPPASWAKVSALLAKDDDASVRDMAGRLGVLFREGAAIARAMKTAEDVKQDAAKRVAALRDLGTIKPKEAEPLLIGLVFKDGPTEVRVEACRALAGYENAGLAKNLLGKWKALPGPVRLEGVNLLSGRKGWAKDLLSGVGSGTVDRRDLNDNTILRILAFKDKDLNQQVEKVWGKFRDSPKELAALIDKMRGEMHTGTASFERGRKVFETQCAKCHNFEGRGAHVGPQLDGAARDIEYLLANILDPNRVIGAPYLLRLVELKDGRIETGLLHAEDENSVTLKVENDQLKVIAKKDIEGKVRVLDKSMMPEGLSAAMTVQDFRDLVKYVMAHPFITEATLARSAAAAISKLEVVHTGPAGRFDLRAPLKASVRTKLTAAVEAPGVTKTRLLLGLNQPVQVYLDDKLVHRAPGNPKAIVQPDMIAIDVTLHKGVNELRLELEEAADAVIYARFLDPDRKLRYPKENKEK
ncbi:MAG: PVC-type heme-binding CxxCH protein [Gemmataceae bacterium]